MFTNNTTTTTTQPTTPSTTTTTNIITNNTTITTTEPTIYTTTTSTLDNDILIIDRVREICNIGYAYAKQLNQVNNTTQIKRETILDIRDMLLNDRTTLDLTVNYKNLQIEVTDLMVKTISALRFNIEIERKLREFQLMKAKGK